MNGPEYLADTNAVIYLLSGNDCMRPYLGKRLAVSVISMMELLSFAGITPEEEKTIRNFLSNCDLLRIGDDVRENAITLRKQYRLKLPDAIIAATAVVNDLPLLTADAGIFKVKEARLEKLQP